MTESSEQILIYHITDLANLAAIVKEGGLHSDVTIAEFHPDIIGYDHIKKRRATEIRVDCCGGRFVGEFVPFYFCPRSPMLFTVNKGNTGRPAGCQRAILHLVSTVGAALGVASDWAIGDGNAGAFHTLFYKDLEELKNLDWSAIRATSWQGLTHQKSAEFLVADFFPWTAFHAIGCYSADVAAQVSAVLDRSSHRPVISVEPSWYY